MSAEPEELSEEIDDDTKILCRGPNRISFCKMHPSTIKAPSILLFNLNNPRLQHIFNVEIDDLIKSFEDLRKNVDDRNFKYECMLSFWLAVHLKKLAEA